MIDEKKVTPGISHGFEVLTNEINILNYTINNLNLVSKTINYQTGLIYLDFQNSTINNTLNFNFFTTKMYPKQDIESYHCFKEIILELLSAKYCVLLPINRAKLVEYNDGFKYLHQLNIKSIKNNTAKCSDYFSDFSYCEKEIKLTDLYEAFLDNHILNVDYTYFDGIIGFTENKNFNNMIDFDMLLQNLHHYLRGGTYFKYKYGKDIIIDVSNHFNAVSNNKYFKIDARVLIHYITQKKYLNTLMSELKFEYVHNFSKLIDLLDKEFQRLIHFELKYAGKKIYLSKRKLFYSQMIERIEDVDCKLNTYIEQFYKYIINYVKNEFPRREYHLDVTQKYSESNIDADNVIIKENITLNKIIAANLTIERAVNVNANLIIIKSSLICEGKLTCEKLIVDKNVLLNENICYSILEVY